MRASRAVVVILALVALAGCAPRTAPPLPAAPAYPEFVYPAGPAGAAEAPGIERGWRFLQHNDLRNAEREFAAVAGRQASIPGATGVAYVALARDDFEQAVRRFDAVIAQVPVYVPALVGRGQALLELRREAEALTSFEAALAADASLAGVRQRVDVLRFRVLQTEIEAARRATAGGRLDEAALGYERAIAASPDSGFLHRELALVERKRGNADAALRHLRRATAIDPADAAAIVQIAEVLEGREDFAGAETAYRRAVELDPTPELKARLASMAERARDATLPAEFRAIPQAPQVTRGELAALIAIRLADVVHAAPVREVVITDVARHWAAAWMTQVARAGVMDPYPNHTFQPREVMTRADLAAAVSRVVALLARGRPPLRDALTERPRIADVAPAHLSYPAVAVAVASGVMRVGDGGQFDVARPVSGAEAIAVVDRLRGLAASR